MVQEGDFPTFLTLIAVRMCCGTRSGTAFSPELSTGAGEQSHMVPCMKMSSARAGRRNECDTKIFQGFPLAAACRFVAPRTSFHKPTIWLDLVRCFRYLDPDYLNCLWCFCYYSGMIGSSFARHHAQQRGKIFLTQYVSYLRS